MAIGFVTLFITSGFWISVGALSRLCTLQIEMQDKMITSNSIEELIGVSNKIRCAVACMKNLRCLTFVYSSSQKKCLMYSMSVDHYRNQLTDVTDGDSIVVRTCRVDTGKTCKTHEECNFQEAACYYGVCLCKLGYYFDPEQGVCLRECEKYGDEMDYYPEAGMREYNDVGVYNITLDACYELCVKEKNFTCLTLEWSKKEDVFSHCLLSKDGFLDVEEHDRMLNCHGWVFAQRRCG